MHIGSSSKLAMTTPDAPIDVLITLQPMTIVQAAADLVWSRVLKEFPNIKIALSEGGIGWVPYFLDRIERTYDMHHHWTGQDLGDHDADRAVPAQRAAVLHLRPRRRATSSTGSARENVCWEMDYPHSRLGVADRSRGPPPRHHVGRPRRRRHRQHHPPHRDALVRLRPVRAHRPGGGDGRCAAEAGRGPRHRHPLDGPGPHRAPRRSTSASCRRRPPAADSLPASGRRRRRRVVVWSTGGVGSNAIRAVACRPDLELVGVWVHTPEKVGRDAGELAGHRRARGRGHR